MQEIKLLFWKGLYMLCPAKIHVVTVGSEYELYEPAQSRWVQLYNPQNQNGVNVKGSDVLVVEDNVRGPDLWGWHPDVVNTTEVLRVPSQQDVIPQLKHKPQSRVLLREGAMRGLWFSDLHSVRDLTHV